MAVLFRPRQRSLLVPSPVHFVRDSILFDFNILTHPPLQLGYVIKYTAFDDHILRATYSLVRICVHFLTKLSV